MRYEVLTDYERLLISEIVTDNETGRHLLRTDKEWESKPYKKEDYYSMVDSILEALALFNWIVDGDRCNRKQYEILLYAKCCSSKEFNDIVNG